MMEKRYVPKASLKLKKPTVIIYPSWVLYKFAFFSYEAGDFSIHEIVIDRNYCQSNVQYLYYLRESAKNDQEIFVILFK